MSIQVNDLVRIKDRRSKENIFIVTNLAVYRGENVAALYSPQSNRYIHYDSYYGHRLKPNGPNSTSMVPVKNLELSNKEIENMKYRVIRSGDQFFDQILEAAEGASNPKEVFLKDPNDSKTFYKYNIAELEPILPYTIRAVPALSTSKEISHYYTVPAHLTTSIEVGQILYDPRVKELLVIRQLDAISSFEELKRKLTRDTKGCSILEPKVLK